ncbi:MAG: tetratricopeptide repeat protein [Candidatus Thermoplasmatota archaeon]
MASHPSEMVGREEELERLKALLDDAIGGRGTTVLVSGEAGIGKTRLVEALLDHAMSQGVLVLSGRAALDRPQPFYVLSEAMDERAGAPLFREEEYVSFAKVLAVDQAGLLLGISTSESTESIDADILAGMLSAVQNFVKDSFDSAGSATSGLGRLEYGDMKILVEHGEGIFLVAVFSGSEHPDMRPLLTRTVRRIEGSGILRTWSGRMEDVQGVQEEIDRISSTRFLVRRKLEGLKLEDERLRLADAALAVLTDASDPVLLVLEDLHWADESSLFVLQYLARNISGHRILILGTYRPEEGGAGSTIAKMRIEGTTQEIALGGLKDDCITALINRLYSPNRFPKGFVDSLTARCEGNPFFVGEVLRHMNSVGSMRQEDGAYIIHDEGLALPHTVEEVVNRRLETLEPEAMTLAEYASCIGRDFPRAAVLSIGLIRDPKKALEELEHTGIVHSTNGSLDFSHALFQDVIYKGINDRWKMAYHQKIGEYYEQTYEERLEDVLYDLARHFSRSRVHEKGFDYCLRAGEKAESAYAAEQAIIFYEDALRALANTRGIVIQREREVDIRERLGDLYALCGRHTEASCAYEALAECIEDKRSKARLRRKVAEVDVKVGDFAKAEDECLNGLKVLEGESCDEEARILCVLGGLMDKTGDYDRGIEVLKEALAVAERLGNRTELAHAYHGLGGLFLSRSRFDDAVRYLKEALSIRRELGAEMDISKSLNNLGIAHWYMGDLEMALRCLEESLAIKSKVGDRQGVATAYSNIGMVHRNKGNLEKALECHFKSLEMKRKIGDKYGIGNSCHNIGVTYEDLGDWDLALAYLEESLAIRQQIGDKNGIANAYNSIGLIYGYKGEYAKALDFQRRSLALAREIDYKRIIIHSQLGIASACIATGDLREALENVEDAVDLASSIGAKREEGMCHNVLGNIRRAERDFEGASSEFQRAKEILKAMDARSTLAILLYDYGTLWAELGEREKAEPLLEEALSMFDQMNMKHWMEKARKALDDL